MRIINFTIKGNHENQKGNPVPYVRYTQGGHWKPQAKRYNEWKDYVRTAFLDALEGKNKSIATVAIWHHQKPVILLNNQKAEMDIKTFWKNHAHGDPDNIWKGIADALFQNDKNLDGSFESEVDPENPRVEVKITINQT